MSAALRARTCGMSAGWASGRGAEGGMGPRPPIGRIGPRPRAPGAQVDDRATVAILCKAMSPSGAEYVKQVRAQVDEVDPAEVRELLDEGVVIVDVREQEEWDAGHLPGAVHVPRGYLESRIDGVAPDRAQRVILYCASGQRSALGANTLQRDLGFGHVESMTGGYHAVEGPRPPRRRPAGLHARAAPALLAPLPAARDRPRGPAEAPRRQGAAARRRRPGLADGALPRRRRRRHARRRRRRRRRRLEPPAPGHPHDRPRGRARRSTPPRQSIKALNPDVEVRKYPFRLDASNIVDVIKDYDVVVDGVDNFPTRYLLNDASVRLRIPVVSAAILGFEGQLSVFTPYDGPCYRCLFRQPPPAEMAPSLRGQRRPRRAARHDGPAAGDRGHQARRRHRRPAHRPPPDLRRARRLDDRAQDPPRPRVPDLLARRRRRSPTRSSASSRTTRRSAPPRARVPRLMATIRIPPVLRPSVGGEREVSADGSTVGEVLGSLSDGAPRDEAAALRRRRRR